MKIDKHTVASIHYTLTDDDGNILDSSSGKDPLTYLHGAGNLIPGMEEGLAGKATGDKFSIDVAPAKGYGEKDSSKLIEVEKEAFGEQAVEVGMQFQLSNGSVASVVAVSDKTVTLDGNHPLAGQALHFDVEVTEVRAATENEVSSGSPAKA